VGGEGHWQAAKRWRLGKRTRRRFCPRTGTLLLGGQLAECRIPWTCNPQGLLPQGLPSSCWKPNRRWA